MSPNRLVLLSLTLPAVACELAHRPEQLARESSSIVGGELYTGDPAVVLVDLGPVGGYCTGSVITPSVVVTAAHCLSDAGNMRARLVNDADDSGPSIAVTTGMAPSQGDIALLALGEPVSGIKPIAFNTTSLEGREGQPVRLVGFGATAETAEDFGVKREGEATLARVAAFGREVRSDEMATTNQPQGTCYGDSGGPNFMTINGSEYLVAVTSRGTDRCGAGLDVAVRTDAHASFLYEFLRANDPVGCAAIPKCVLDAEPMPKHGGCGTAPAGGGVTALALLALLWRRRRRRRRNVHACSAIVLAGGLLLTGCDSGTSPDGGKPRSVEPPPGPQPTPTAPASPTPAPGQPPIDESCYVSLKSLPKAKRDRAMAMLELLKKKDKMTDDDHDKVDEWKKQEIDPIADAHLDKEAAEFFKERYTRAADDATKAELRDEYAHSQAAKDKLAACANAVHYNHLYGNKMWGNKLFEAEVMYNAMYLAHRQALAKPERRVEPPPTTGPNLDPVDDTVARCADRLRIQAKHYYRYQR
jgi:MYXO-CTERM domain-containing protein